MQAIINVNGKISGEHEAVISVLDHGFLYGEGVYEVVRTYDRRPFLLDRHLLRLERSAEMLTLRLPLSHAAIEDRVRETASVLYRQQPPGTEAYIRIITTRGVGDISYDYSKCLTPSLVIIVKPMVPHPAEVYERGVRVVLVTIVRNHPCSVSPLIKSNNLLNNALAAQEAQRRNAFEAIMRNYRGEISEGAVSNVFVVKDGTLFTPPIDAGLLAGITRGFVLELAPSVGVTTRESPLHDQDLFAADECFMTSSTQEIVPVVSVDDRIIGPGHVGPVTRILHQEYRRRIASLRRP